VPTDAVALERFRALGDRVSVEPSVLGPTVSWPGDVVATSDLSASSFDRELDWWWRRTSFSDITAGTYEARVASEPEEAVIDDESAPHAPPVEDTGDDELRAIPSLLAEMPVGTEVGTLIHRVFESTDFAAEDLDLELVEQVAAAQARRRVELGELSGVIAGLRAALETPLGPMASGLALRDVARADRLDELDFELPLVGGEDPSGPALTLSAIAGVLRSYSEPGDPLASYAERLLDPRLRSEVRGYLAGSIDLVLRLPGERFAVVDYKTNWLALPGEDLSAWHHRPAALSAEMTHSHYGLQALLYTVALHRYLRWRLPGYSAERNLAGVLYLFIRGMTGPETPLVDGIPCGVFTWQPSAELVEALSDVLDRGEGVPLAGSLGSAHGRG
jgi:exodeoxyribonuclease V beta subunit